MFTEALFRRVKKLEAVNVYHWTIMQLLEIMRKYLMAWKNIQKFK